MNYVKGVKKVAGSNKKSAAGDFKPKAQPTVEAGSFKNPAGSGKGTKFVC